MRGLCVAGALLAIAAGLAVRHGHRGFWPKYSGDALWTCVVYALVVFVRPTLRPTQAGLIALGISFTVEFAQITPGPAWLSSKHFLLGLIFGATFSPYDLIAYAVGAGLCFSVHTALSRWCDGRTT